MKLKIPYAILRQYNEKISFTKTAGVYPAKGESSRSGAFNNIYFSKKFALRSVNSTKFNLVGDPGLEPGTSGSQSRHSSQLSQSP